MDPKKASPDYNFEIDLADADRSVYESLALRVARHPSETEEYLVTRVLVYAMEHTEGIAFSTGGLSDPDEPALFVCGSRSADDGAFETKRSEPRVGHAPRLVTVLSFAGSGQCGPNVRFA